MDFPCLRTGQTQPFDGKSHAQTLKRSQIRQYDKWSKTRLSKNFILRDFLFSAECAVMGLGNLPEDPAMAVRAGRALCDKVLEPVLAHFGKFAITFGYQCREAIESDMRSSAGRVNSRSSNPSPVGSQNVGQRHLCPRRYPSLLRRRWRSRQT